MLVLGEGRSLGAGTTGNGVAIGAGGGGLGGVTTAVFTGGGITLGSAFGGSGGGASRLGAASIWIAKGISLGGGG